MDMYQKREMRKNKKVEKNEENIGKTNINWVIFTKCKTLQTLEK